MKTEVITLFNTLYGRDFPSRAKKLREECIELVEAIDNLSTSPKDGELDMLIDEMADVLAVLTHVADLMNMSCDSLLEAALNKVQMRASDPDYHKKFDYLCPNCSTPLRCGFHRNNTFSYAICLNCLKNINPIHVKIVEKINKT